MAKPFEFKLDRNGARAFLNSQPVADLVKGIADQVAANVRSGVPDDVPVEVDMYTSDRPVASVAIKHPSGKGRQLKHGALTRAAGQVGLEVRPR